MNKCIFCEIINGKQEATVIDEDEMTITFFDIRPLFPGHCLVLPKQHFVTLADLPKELIDPLFVKAQKISKVLPNVLNCQGTFVAMNNIVSQSVPHLHVHVVPRTKGDGLKGFFWPRNGYESEVKKREIADKIRAGLKSQ